VLGGQRDFAIQRLTSELDDLKRRIESMSGALTVNVPVASKRLPLPRQRSEAERQLLAADIESGVVASLLAETGPNATPDQLRAAIEGIIKTDANLGTRASSRRIVALVGPPGAGKTTTLVKLAARYGLAARRSMHLISTDMYRIGGADQLRLYASILGVGFQAVETPLALAQALEDQRRKELVFIDTPGWGHKDVPEIRELAEYLANDAAIDIHLVVPATGRMSDLERLMERYAIFRASKLLFTRLDETDRLGAIVNLSHRSGKPLSFFCFGQQVPEDLEPATGARVADLILGPTHDAEVTAEAAYMEGPQT
jgi:flagellar biosynthesis protein FlhF